MDKALGVKDAAIVLGVSVGFLDKARCRGGGPRFAKIGTRVVYRQRDLDDFLEHRVRGSTVEVRDDLA